MEVYWHRVRYFLAHNKMSIKSPSDCIPNFFYEANLIVLLNLYPKTWEGFLKSINLFLKSMHKWTLPRFLFPKHSCCVFHSILQVSSVNFLCLFPLKRKCKFGCWKEHSTGNILQRKPDKLPCCGDI